MNSLILKSSLLPVEENYTLKNGSYFLKANIFILNNRLKEKRWKKKIIGENVECAKKKSRGRVFIINAVSQAVKSLHTAQLIVALIIKR